jgi:hypothetical protein
MVLYGHRQSQKNTQPGVPAFFFQLEKEKKEKTRQRPAKTKTKTPRPRPRPKTKTKDQDSWLLANKQQDTKTKKTHHLRNSEVQSPFEFESRNFERQKQKAIDGITGYWFCEGEETNPRLAPEKNPRRYPDWTLEPEQKAEKEEKEPLTERAPGLSLTRVE